MNWNKISNLTDCPISFSVEHFITQTNFEEDLGIVYKGITLEEGEVLSFVLIFIPVGQCTVKFELMI